MKSIGSLSLRKELIGCKRLVVKVGSNVVTKSDGRCDVRKMRIIVEDICELVERGFEVILVSSGAVNVGKAFLKRMLPKEGRVDLQQSASSIGQPKLINKYSQLFEDHNHICSQILLTHDDFRNRKRFLHAKQTIEVLLQNKVTPILNENDSISYSENSVGDNDHLAASAAQMVHADALIIITSEHGLYDRDPLEKDAKLIKVVDFGDELNHIDMSSKTNAGRGGMESKIHAVMKVTPLGIKAVISSKDNERIVLDPLTKEIGTLFGPETNFHPDQKKAWLISTKKTNCYLEVDRGAYEALLEGHSLFPRGITSCFGRFFHGDSIDLCFEGKPFAVGISEYDKVDVDRIKDSHSDDIEDILGYKTSSAVVLTQNLLLTEEI
jgi:glutamate 5-kinase